MNFVIIQRLEGSNWFGVLIFMFQDMVTLCLVEAKPSHVIYSGRLFFCQSREINLSCILFKFIVITDSFLRILFHKFYLSISSCRLFCFLESTAVEQVVACALVTQQARVQSPVRTSFLGVVFWGFSSPVRRMSGSFRPTRSPNIIWPS